MQEIEMMANRIILALALPLLLVMDERYFFATVGISLFPDDAQDGETLLVHANAAAIHANRKGK